MKKLSFMMIVASIFLMVIGAIIVSTDQAEAGFGYCKVVCECGACSAVLNIPSYCYSPCIVTKFEYSNCAKYCRYAK